MFFAPPGILKKHDDDKAILLVFGSGKVDGCSHLGDLRICHPRRHDSPVLDSRWPGCRDSHTSDSTCSPNGRLRGGKGSGHEKQDSVPRVRRATRLPCMPGNGERVAAKSTGQRLRILPSVPRYRSQTSHGRPLRQQGTVAEANAERHPASTDSVHAVQERPVPAMSTYPYSCFLEKRMKR